MEMELPYSKNLPPLNELTEELGKEAINWILVITLLSETLEYIQSFPLSLLIIELVRYASLCIFLDGEEKIKFPLDIIRFIEDIQLLYIYPASYSPVTPESLYKKSLEVKQKYDDNEVIKTHRKKVIKYTSLGYSVEKIIQITGINKKDIEKIIIYEKLLREEISLGKNSVWFNLWFLNIK